jgi:hypothetical protein
MVDIKAKYALDGNFKWKVKFNHETRRAEEQAVHYLLDWITSCALVK